MRENTTKNSSLSSRPQNTGGIWKRSNYHSFLFEENFAWKSRYYGEVIVSEELRFQNVFRSQLNTERFKKVHFSVGLMWTAGLTEETGLCLQIHSAYI